MSRFYCLWNDEHLSHGDRVDVCDVIRRGNFCDSRSEADRDRRKIVARFDGICARLGWSASRPRPGVVPAFGRDRHRSRDRELVARFEQLRIGAHQLTHGDAVFNRHTLEGIPCNDLVFLRSIRGIFNNRSRSGEFIQLFQRAIEQIQIHIGIDAVDDTLFTILPDRPLEPAARQQG